MRGRKPFAYRLCEADRRYLAQTQHSCHQPQSRRTLRAAQLGRHVEQRELLGFGTATPGRVHGGPRPL
jgi:hypothetical protein